MPYDWTDVLLFEPKIMTISFKHKGLKDFFETGLLKGVQCTHIKKVELILDFLNAASDVTDMNFPGSCLHKLEPKGAGIWAVKVNKNWRITFTFNDGNAYNVNYEDYH